jgi:hypothetical protein
MPNWAVQIHTRSSGLNSGLNILVERPLLLGEIALDPRAMVFTALRTRSLGIVLWGSFPGTETAVLPSVVSDKLVGSHGHCPDTTP